MESIKREFKVLKGVTYHITHFFNAMPDTDYFLYSNTDVPYIITNKGTRVLELSFDETLEHDVLFVVSDTLIPEPEINDYLDHIKEEPNMLPPAHAFLPPLDIDERSDQYGWEYPAVDEILCKFENNHIDITEKVLKFENDLTQIKNDLDEIKDAIMAINRKMDSY
jgi:hypothetical protein